MSVARLLALVVLLAAPVALAQSSGGAIGGENWGSSSSSSSSSRDYGGGDDYSSRHDHGGGNDYSSRHGSSYDNGGAGGCDDDGMAGVYIVLFLGVVIVWVAAHASQAIDPTQIDPSLARTYGDLDHPRVYADTDVTRIAVVLDARVRAPVQAALAQIAARMNTASADERARMLGEVTLLLRRHRAMWLYGSASNHALTTSEQARAAFQRAVLSARATYVDETILNIDGCVVTAPSDAVARPEEGPGVILVTILVAARRELVTVMRPGDAESLRLALETLGSLTPSTLLAVKIVWTPSNPNDRMTTVEAEQILRSCDGDYATVTGAAVGVAVCAFCAQLYPAEAFACVHCGAPPASRVRQPEREPDPC